MANNNRNRDNYRAKLKRRRKEARRAQERLATAGAEKAAGAQTGGKPASAH